jgi:hypothetical protein
MLELFLLFVLVVIGITTTMGGKQAQANLHKAEVLNEVPTPQERSRLLFWTIVGCLAALGGCFAALSTATP